jgi:hypothetical protein
MMRRAKTAPDPVERHIAGYLEKTIADEENSGAIAKLRGSQSDILVHRQRREGDVGAIQKLTMYAIVSSGTMRQAILPNAAFSIAVKGVRRRLLQRAALSKP